MIKAGDKVICINSYYDEINFMTEIPCEIGDICIVDEIRKHSYDGTIYSIVLFGDWTFDKNIFSKYFIPIAEWREQQIKSVLDD